MTATAPATAIEFSEVCCLIACEAGCGASRRMRPSGACAMRVATFALALLVLVASSATAATAALNHNRQAINNLATAYGFILGQEYSLARIEKTFPSLRLRVEAARAGFVRTFGNIGELLERELILALGERKFHEMRNESRRRLVRLIEQEPLTLDLAGDFLRKVEARAKGAEIEPEVLRYLLAVKYAGAPVEEFLDGFRQRFSTDGTGKARGVRLKLQLPLSWLAQEGERPHIVRKWISEGGTGTSVILLDIRDARGGEPSAEEMERLARSGEAHQVLGDLGKISNLGTFTLEGRKGLKADLTTEQERAGIHMRGAGSLYQLFLPRKRVGIMCMTYALESASQKPRVSGAAVRPLCRQVVNSLILEQAY